MILLASDVLTVLRPEDRYDAHGWHVDGDLADIAVEVGNLQIDSSPQFTVQATGGEDRGPAEPAQQRRAMAYLTPDTAAVLGDILDVSGKGRWRVVTLNVVTDPINGYATCQVAQCQGVDQ